MTKMLLMLLLLATTASQVWAVLPATTVAEVRTAGAQTNGGGWDTAGTGVDMSQYDNKNAAGCSSCYSSSANLSTTDAVANGTTTITSATAAFTSDIDGNIIFLNNQWYRATYVDATTITVDRPVTTATGLTMNIGGAFKIGGTLDDDWWESFEAGNVIWVKNGLYTYGETVTTSKAGSASNPIRIIGYNSTRGDTPIRTLASDNRPVINCGTLTYTSGGNWDLYNMRFFGTSTVVYAQSAANKFINSQVYNLSSTADRAAIQTSTDGYIAGSEFVSLRGRAVQLGNAVGIVFASYIHASNEGVYLAYAQGQTIINNIIEDNVLNGINLNAAVIAKTEIIGNTIVGAPTPRSSSTGIKMATGVTDIRAINNILSGWATGVSHADTQSVGVDLNNVYYNNAANTNGSGNWAVSSTSITGTDPAFTAYTAISGTGATSTTNVLTAGSGTPFTNVVDKFDFVYITCPTSCGTGFAAGMYPISAHDGTTLTLAWEGSAINVTTSGNGSGISWEIIQGHNYAVGTGLKAAGFPTTWLGLTNNYVEPGAAQRQEPVGGGGTKVYLGGN